MLGFLDWVVSCWRSVMDLRFNPIRFIPDPVTQSYLMFALFIMWSGFFGVIAIFYLGWITYSIPMSIFIHCLVVVPTVITNAVFLDAERTGAPWLQKYRDKIKLKKFLHGKNVVRWDLENEG